MSDSFNMVTLAAGKGTRLKIDLAKPLCPALGRKIVDYVIEGLLKFSEDENIKNYLGFVVGHQKEKVEQHILDCHARINPKFAFQEQQLGTGHALKTYFDQYNDAWDNTYTIVVCADTPLITAEVYAKLYSLIKDKDADAVCATFKVDDPTGYGRIEKAKQGFNIVEEKDADETQKQIKEVNSALYIFKTSHIKKYIETLNTQNNSGEFYLTDLFKEGMNVHAECFEDSSLFLGINNLIQLEQVEEILSKRKKESLMLNGVRMLNAKSIYIEDQVVVGTGSVLYPGVSLHGKTTIKENVTIENNAVIKDSSIDNNSIVLAGSYIESAKIAKDCAIGPMARLRVGTDISDKCKIGNFVETKKSSLAQGVKVSHLSYVGDAEIGENTNIGCGFITCNYDGKNKFKTVIGKDSFIGSDSQMIAPITIGDRCFVASGSTINQDIPDDGFAISRTRQTTKENMAKKFIKKKD